MGVSPIIRSIPQIIYKAYELLLTQEVKSEELPRHVAIIMDGNRRYARKHGQKQYFGHYKGADVTERVLEWGCELGIRYLTVYAFSTENFNRSDEEKDKLFELIKIKFDEITVDERAHNQKVRIHAIGEIEKLPETLQKSIKNAELATSNYDNFNLNVAIAYGGRQEIVQAVREIARKVEIEELEPEEINEDTIASHLYPTGSTSLPDVDLIVRTGGDERVSNFLPWQANGNDCAAYFCAPYWPEVRKIDFLRSIRVYQSRMKKKRRHTASRAAHFLKALGEAEMEEVRQHSKDKSKATD